MSESAARPLVGDRATRRKPTTRAGSRVSSPACRTSTRSIAAGSSRPRPKSRRFPSRSAKPRRNGSDRKHDALRFAARTLGRRRAATSGAATRGLRLMIFARRATPTRAAISAHTESLARRQPHPDAALRRAPVHGPPVARLRAETADEIRARGLAAGGDVRDVFFLRARPAVDPRSIAKWPEACRILAPATPISSNPKK